MMITKNTDHMLAVSIRWVFVGLLLMVLPLPSEVRYYVRPA